MSAADCVTFPGFTHALCWAFRTDNSGPPESVDEVMSYFEIARYQFPGAEVSDQPFWYIALHPDCPRFHCILLSCIIQTACYGSHLLTCDACMQVYASTYDNFTSQLAGIRDQLPVVSHEVGDIWVMGVPSDPWKNIWYVCYCHACNARCQAVN